MRIGGLLKFSLIDFPGKVAGVIFTQGCNYRCPFCHNPELVLPNLFADPLDSEEVFSFFEKRKEQLQGVVITGGEPTLHDDLPLWMERFKAMGYLVKLDTNGSRPNMLKDIIQRKCVDYIAMDIKTSLFSYEKATGVAIDIEGLKASVDIIKHSGIDYEFRTTALKAFLQDEDMRFIASWMEGAKKYYVRRGNLKDKILNFNYFADMSDYTDEEWDFIKMLSPCRKGGDT